MKLSLAQLKVKQQQAFYRLLVYVLIFAQSSANALDLIFPQLTLPTPSSPQSSTTRPSPPSNEPAQFERSQWQLSESEWQRYLSLMQGIRGSISPKTLSPIEVLGVHAETDTERNHYAKLWAKMLHEDVQRSLAFQLAYQAATQELYGGNPQTALTLPGTVPNATASRSQKSALRLSALADGDRLLVFLKIKECPQCAVTVQKLLAASTAFKVQVDLYFLDTQATQDDGLIINWAKQQALDTGRLAAKTLTLNHDLGNHYRVTGQLTAKPPAVFVIRQHQMYSLTL